MTAEADSDVKSPQQQETTIDKRKERKAKREVRKAKRLEKKAKRQQSWGWRIFRLIFHILWLPVLLVGGLAGGLIIGYTVIGGGSPLDVFGRELWQHLYDIIYAEG